AVSNNADNSVMDSFMLYLRSYSRLRASSRYPDGSGNQLIQLRLQHHRFFNFFPESKTFQFFS
ncbi:hypothetical protein QLY51_21345, partial [Cronobacter sakazakii]|nr:hypothetical protein [Cronobacter sakazakii]